MIINLWSEIFKWVVLKLYCSYCILYFWPDIIWQYIIMHVDDEIKISLDKLILTNRSHFILYFNKWIIVCIILSIIVSFF